VETAVPLKEGFNRGRAEREKAGEMCSIWWVQVMFLPNPSFGVFPIQKTEVYSSEKPTRIHCI